MSISIIQEPGRFSFTGNPVYFDVESDTDVIIPVEIVTEDNTYPLSYYPYRSGETYKCRIDIAGYLFTLEQAIYADDDTIISPVSGFESAYQVKIGDDYTFDGYALKGGITKQAIKTLTDNGFDIFTFRLNSIFEQFLFTTRTNGREIVIKETELQPFFFINPEVSITFRSASGNNITVPAVTSSNICRLDAGYLRSRFNEQFGEMPDTIEVRPLDELAFTFRIIPGMASEEKYYILFRNSLGAFEKMEVAGVATHEPEFNDENNYNTHTEYGFTEERRDRVLSRDNITVETGYKTRPELPFLLDMIKSNEAYFYYPDGTHFRCHVRSEGPQFRHRMITPTSFTLSVIPVLEEEYTTLSFDPDSLIYEGGIFDETFDETHE